MTQDQSTSSTTTYSHQTLRRGCSVQLYVVHDNRTHTFISRAHVQAGRCITVAVMVIFQYCRINFITGSRMFSSKSGLMKVEGGDLRFVDLLNNGHCLAFVKDCDARYLFCYSRVKQGTFLLSARSLNIIWHPSGYLLILVDWASPGYSDHQDNGTILAQYIEINVCWSSNCISQGNEMSI